jgi:hypothetical protein
MSARSGAMLMSMPHYWQLHDHSVNERTERLIADDSFLNLEIVNLFRTSRGISPFWASWFQVPGGKRTWR